MQYQMQKMRENMIADLLEVIDKYRTHIGPGMMSSDVVGALEWCKMEVYKEASEDSLLDHTSYSTD